MIQTFFGILALLGTAFFAFGLGVAEEIKNPTKAVDKPGWLMMRSFCFWGSTFMMILSGLLLGYK